MASGGRSFGRLRLIGVGVLIALVSLVAVRKLDPFFFRLKVRTVEAAFGVEETRLQVDGLIVRNEQIVRAPAPGRVTLLVGEGRRVRRGDVVVEVTPADGDSPSERQADVDRRLNRARAAFEAERATLAREEQAALARFEEAERELRSALAAGDREASEAAARNREARAAALSAVRERIDALEASFRETQAALLAERRAALTLRPDDAALVASPGSGVVSFSFDTHVGLRPGAPLGAELFEVQLKEERVYDGLRVEQGDALFRLFDPTAGVELLVRGRGRAPLSAGAEVQLALEHIPGRTYTGRLLEVVQEVREWWGRVAILHPDESLAQRRRVSAILSANRAQGVVVPARALVEEGGRTGVYVMLGDQPIFREVVVLGGNERRLVIDAPRGVPVGAPVVANPEVVRERRR